jgi:methylase of polypeptide subunit release factors
MLDVGTGVAALAVAYAELFPQLTVVGIDVIPRVLALAEQTVTASSVSDRVLLRQQDVSSLDEPETYAFAWVPAPFIPESALGVGVVRVVQSLLPGGWLMLGHGKYGGSAVDDAVGRFKTVAYGRHGP